MSRLLTTTKNSQTWECLLNGRYLKNGLEIIFGNNFTATLQERNGDVWVIAFNCTGVTFQRRLEQYGQVPLPPYIKKVSKKYKKQYQTVYADSKHKGSVEPQPLGYILHLV